MKAAYTTLTEAVEAYQAKGYTVDFDLVEDGVHSKGLKKKWNAGELEVVEFHRFEGMTNPSDNMILYVIECTDGSKGLLVDAYGADVYISREMIEKLRMNTQE
ncbi:MAG: phosphoribosylpyrophosphate synthetase [Nonlabens sp.]